MLKAYYTDLNLYNDDDIQSLLPHISEERRLFALRLKNRERFRECVVSEALARVSLIRTLESSGFTGEQNMVDAGIGDNIAGLALKPSDIKICRTDRGKPYQVTIPRLFFSISHSKGLCFCAVGDVNTGADVEKNARIRPGREGFFLSGSEMLLYEGAEEAGKQALLTKLWCRKESLLKLIGTGFDRKPSRVDTVAAAEDFIFFDGIIDGGFCWSVCQKKSELGLDKSDEITQSPISLYFLKSLEL
jgi:hypothetical protein